MSSNRQITYNTGSARELLSCTNYLSCNDPGYRIFLLATFALMVGAIGLMQVGGIPIPISEIFLISCILILLPAFANTLMVLGLVKDPRSCTTSFTEAGVIDQTERSGVINLPWNSIIAMKINHGSVYFFTWRRSVYVPAYAFASLEDATDFYNEAHRLWRESQDKKVSARITSMDDALLLEADTMSRIQEFDAQEEAMWKQMEEDHRKTRENGQDR